MGYWFMISAAIFIVISVSSYYRMLAEINRHAPPDEQVSEFFGWPGRFWRDLSLYRRWNPGGRLHWVCLTSSILFLLCFMYGMYKK